MPHHKKPSQKSSIESGDLRPRRSRHGRIMVGQAPKGFNDPRPSPYWREALTQTREVPRTVTQDPITGDFIVVPAHTMTEEISPRRLMTAEEVQQARSRIKRATSPTNTYGKKNAPDNIAPRGRAGQKGASA